MSTFDWADYLTFAEEIAQRPDEAALRSAISRAYYSAYCKARNHLSQSGVNVRTSSHKWLWDNFRMSDDEDIRSLGLTGDRLRMARNRADYDNVFSDLNSAVLTALPRARQIVQAV
jgi:uncharacterized protein (UPF0332 family)